MSEIADYDLCVIGGGINGAGIARDAAGRGLTVILAEARDLASATSSSSSKLVHGGLRYLEQREFKLVRESLQERSILLKIAPHIIWPLDFILPHDSHLRPAWMIRLGLFLYDHLAGFRRIKKSQQIDFATHPSGDPLKSQYKIGFAYADAWVDDARLVVLNAMDAKARGADILTHTAVINITPRDDAKGWKIIMRDMIGGDETHITTRAIVNAGGPWVRAILDTSELGSRAPGVRLVKGSHIIVSKIHSGSQAYILQQPDGRVVFALPYEHQYTLIGTTDVPFEGDPTSVMIDDTEKEYLCAAANRFFERQTTPLDIKWSYSGVRSLYDDGDKNISKVTRDYRLEMDKSHGAPLLSVFGGKITTHRRLSELVVDKIAPLMGNKRWHWTHTEALPGGDLSGVNFDQFIKEKNERYPFLPLPLLYRYARSYGTRMDKFLGGADDLSGLGRCFGEDLYEAEVIYLLYHEFARNSDDILWRRSKLGLHVSDDTVRKLDAALPQLLEDMKRNG
jgi:glycerol-3-phosphate dehydrogenase